MKTIEERANETFPEKWRNVTIGGTMEYAFDDNEAYREGFIEGAKSEHEVLTKWHTPDEIPTLDEFKYAKNIIIKDEYDDYLIGYYNHILKGWFDSNGNEIKEFTAWKEVN